MLIASPPPRFNIAFASGAGGGFIRPIPQASQIGITPGAASLTDGFPPLNFQPVAAGGIPPFGEDFNGILNQLSLWSQWQEAGGIIRYDATFAAGGGGGYPAGAIVTSNVVLGNRWLSVVDNNTQNPDSLTQTNWCQDPGSIATGTPVPSFSSAVPPGYLAANASTMGTSGSNATFAATTSQLLYRYIWFNFSNSICPILTSGGVPTTRGANPDADFAALKQLTLPDMRGIGLRGVDTMGGGATTRLSGVPVNAGNATTPGSSVGENLHTLVTSELAQHNHGLTDTQTWALTNVNSLNGITTTISGGLGFTGGASSQRQINSPDITIARSGSLAVNNAGSGSAHNNVALDRLVYWNLKL